MAVFGAAVVAGRTGVVLQNRSAYFSLDPKSPNKVEPGKTPLHTLIASLAFRDDKLWAVLGCMGADGQPQIHLQTYLAMIDHGRDIQQALETPRFLSGRFASARRATRCTSRAASRPRPSPSWSGAATWSTAGATGTNRPAMPTASRSIRRAACWSAAPTRAATARRSRL